MRTIFTVCLLALGAVNAAVAAPPELKSLAPAGAQRGTSTTITAAGTFPKWPVQAWVSGDGVRLEPLKDKGKFTANVDRDAAPGVRWVRLIGDDGVSKVRPLVISSLPEIAEKETNDLLESPHAVEALPTIVNGVLAKTGDVDTYRVSLKRGQTFIASLDANTDLGSPIDAVLQLVDGKGFVIDQNHDDRLLDPRLVRTIDRDGDLYVRVFAFPSDPNSSIRFHGAADAIYRLTLTVGPYVDHAFPPVVAAGASKPSVELQGWNLPTTAVNASVNTGEVLTPVALNLPQGTAGSATTMTADLPVLAEQEPNGREHAQTVTTPGLVVGRIASSSDQDAYLVTWQKGQTWRIRAQSKLWGFNVDPLVYLYDKNGTQLFRSDDAGRGNPDSDTTFKVLVNGTYKIVVEDLLGASTLRHGYLLDIRPQDADFALAVSEAEFAAAAGKPLEISVTVDRPSGMTADVTVKVLGLPKALGELQVVSSGKGETAKKVTLKIPANAAFSGPIRIVGVAANDMKTRRLAVAPVAGIASARLVDLWLTIPPAKK
jgi:hypothetical protein